MVHNVNFIWNESTFWIFWIRSRCIFQEFLRILLETSMLMLNHMKTEKNMLKCNMISDYVTAIRYIYRRIEMQMQMEMRIQIGCSPPEMFRYQITNESWAVVFIVTGVPGISQEKTNSIKMSSHPINVDHYSAFTRLTWFNQLIKILHAWF